MVRTAVSDMMQLYYKRESSTSCPETPIPALKIRTTMIRTTIVRLTTSSPSSVRLDRPWLFPPLLQDGVLDPVFPHAAS